VNEVASIGARIARRLIDVGAVAISPAEPFVWASGLRSPIYCDNRLTLGYPEARSEIAEAFAARVRKFDPEVEAVIGVATGAIAHASFVAERTGLPLGYVRSEAKGHGKRNRLEGFARTGSRVVVIEDLVSTGGSSVAAVDGVRQAGMEVAGVLAIFSYGFASAEAAFSRADVELTSLATLFDLLTAAREEGMLDADSVALVEDWRRDPEGWSEAHGS
jgi:orotate phosphoribosyltransferase